MKKIIVTCVCARACTRMVLFNACMLDSLFCVQVIAWVTLRAAHQPPHFPRVASGNINGLVAAKLAVKPPYDAIGGKIDSKRYRASPGALKNVLLPFLQEKNRNVNLGC